MKNNGYPDKWEICRLGDFVITEKGKKPKSISKEKSNEFQIPYVNIKAFEQKKIDEYTNGDGCVFCEDGDFLMVWDGSRSGYVGKAIKGALGSTLVKIKFPEISKEYAYYFLQSKFLEINTRAKGVGIPHVDPSLVWNYTFPIPPLSEQHRIVTKIEELFSELDKGVESLKIAQQQLKVYRQAVLKWAFEENRFSNGWTWVMLEKVADKITDGEHLRPKTQGKGIPFLSAKDVRSEGVSFDNPLYISEETARKSWERCNPQKDDILIVSRGATVGRMCIVNTYEKFCLLGSVILIKLSKSVNNKFICYALKSPATNQIITSISGATAQQAIYLRDIKNIKIPVCPLSEQERIAEEIESRLSVCDKIEETIEQSLKQAEGLRQSILKKAFKGKLVTQNTNDEPASKLLERIRDAKKEVKELKGKIKK